MVGLTSNVIHSQGRDFSTTSWRMLEKWLKAGSASSELLLLFTSPQPPACREHSRVMLWPEQEMKYYFQFKLFERYHTWISHPSTLCQWVRKPSAAPRVKIQKTDVKAPLLYFFPVYAENSLARPISLVLQFALIPHASQKVELMWPLWDG